MGFIRVLLGFKSDILSWFTLRKEVKFVKFRVKSSSASEEVRISS